MNIKTSDYSTVLYQKLCNNYVKTEIKNTNIAEENEIFRYAAAKSLQSCPTLCDPIDPLAAHQAPPSLGFSRQEHWSGLSFPSPMHKSEK